MPRLTRLSTRISPINSTGETPSFEGGEGGTGFKVFLVALSPNQSQGRSMGPCYVANVGSDGRR